MDFILNQNNGIYPRYYSKEKIGRSKRLAEERRMAVFLQNRRMSKREGKGYNSVYDLLDKHLPGWDSSQNVEERLMDRAYNYVGQWKPEDHLGNSSIQEDFLEEMRQLQKDGKGTVSDLAQKLLAVHFSTGVSLGRLVGLLPLGLIFKLQI